MLRTPRAAATASRELTADKAYRIAGDGASGLRYGAAIGMLELARPARRQLRRADQMERLPPVGCDRLDRATIPLAAAGTHR